MAWPGLDQRVFPRISVRCDITISDKSGDMVKAQTQNLGLGGACVILTRQLEKFTQVGVHLTLGSNDTIDCQGKIVWVITSKEISGKTKFDTGIEFINIDQDAQSRIKSFLARNRS